MEHSENLGALADALAKAQGEIRPAKMNATNPFLKSKYADLGSVMDACRDVLSKYGLSFVQMAFTPAMELHGAAVGVETMLMHESGQWIKEKFVLPVGEERGKSVMQVAGSAITYARRYALAAMLGIVADEDTDGAAVVSKITPASKKDRERLNELGKQAYGDDWATRKLQLSSGVSSRRTDDIDQLSAQEVAELSKGIAAKLNQNEDRQKN